MTRRERDNLGVIVGQIDAALELAATARREIQNSGASSGSGRAEMADAALRTMRGHLLHALRLADGMLRVDVTPDPRD